MTVGTVSEIACKDYHFELVDDVDDRAAVGVVVGFYLIGGFSASIAGNDALGNGIEFFYKIAVHMRLTSIIHHIYYIPEW